MPQWLADQAADQAVLPLVQVPPLVLRPEEVLPPEEQGRPGAAVEALQGLGRQAVHREGQAVLEVGDRAGALVGGVSDRRRVQRRGRADGSRRPPL
jgi:hypothetical protein